MDKGEDAAHACQREVREEVNLDLPLEKIEQLMTVSTPAVTPGLDSDHCSLGLSA